MVAVAGGIATVTWDVAADRVVVRSGPSAGDTAWRATVDDVVTWSGAHNAGDSYVIRTRVNGTRTDTECSVGNGGGQTPPPGACYASIDGNEAVLTWNVDGTPFAAAGPPAILSGRVEGLEDQRGVATASTQWSGTHSAGDGYVLDFAGTRIVCPIPFGNTELSGIDCIVSVKDGAATLEWAILPERSADFIRMTIWGGPSLDAMFFKDQNDTKFAPVAWQGNYRSGRIFLVRAEFENQSGLTEKVCEFETSEVRTEFQLDEPWDEIEWIQDVRVSAGSAVVATGDRGTSQGLLWNLESESLQERDRRGFRTPQSASRVAVGSGRLAVTVGDPVTGDSRVTTLSLDGNDRIIAESSQLLEPPAGHSSAGFGDILEISADGKLLAVTGFWQEPGFAHTVHIFRTDVGSPWTYDRTIFASDNDLGGTLTISDVAWTADGSLVMAYQDGQLDVFTSRGPGQFRGEPLPSGGGLPQTDASGEQFVVMASADRRDSNTASIFTRSGDSWIATNLAQRPFLSDRFAFDSGLLAIQGNDGFTYLFDVDPLGSVVEAGRVDHGAGNPVLIGLDGLSLHYRVNVDGINETLRVVSPD